MTWAWIQDSQEILIASLLVHYWHVALSEGLGGKSGMFTKIPLPWQVPNFKCHEADESFFKKPLFNIFLLGFPEFQSMLFMIQHIPGEEKLNRMLGSFLWGSFLFSWDPEFLAPWWCNIHFLCLPSPVRLIQVLGCCFLLGLLLRAGNWQISQGGIEVRSSKYFPSLRNLGFSSPNSWLCSWNLQIAGDLGAFYITFIVVFHGKFGLILLFSHR